MQSKLFTQVKLRGKNYLQFMSLTFFVCLKVSTFELLGFFYGFPGKHVKMQETADEIINLKENGNYFFSYFPKITDCPNISTLFWMIVAKLLKK